MELKNKKCKPCEGGMPPLKKEKIAEYQKQINTDWKLIDNKKISKDYAFVNYRHTIDFVNRVADLAEEEGHHPVMHVYYGKIQIELWTHAINGLSENDFIMAAKIDSL
jgi:4a-hydroxytetrahydrobiopterin dehydratase